MADKPPTKIVDRKTDSADWFGETPPRYMSDLPAAERRKAQAKLAEQRGEKPPAKSSK